MNHMKYDVYLIFVALIGLLLLPLTIMYTRAFFAFYVSPLVEIPAVYFIFLTPTIGIWYRIRSKQEADPQVAVESRLTTIDQNIEVEKYLKLCHLAQTQSNTHSL